MRRISYAQNGEDVRVWHAFHDRPGVNGVNGVDGVDEVGSFTYVDVGANEPRTLSITASLYDLGWRGLLVEADPELAHELRAQRPGDIVEQAAAGSRSGSLTFYRVPGTGLGTLDAQEAQAARARGYEVIETPVPTWTVDEMLDRHALSEVQFMSIDVEGAEADVLQGLQRHRPWVLCVEAIKPGTAEPSHQEWESDLLAKGYSYAAFDGVNRWYVRSDKPELLDPIATPLNVIDTGSAGWLTAEQARLQDRDDRQSIRAAWQRELLLNQARQQVDPRATAQQIHELRSALAAVEASRFWRLTRPIARIARAVKYRLQRLTQALPNGIRQRIIRERHLRLVYANQQHLVDPAYLGKPPAEQVEWITPAGLPDLPEAAALRLEPLDAAGIAAAGAWLAAGPHDSDAMLVRRTDNHGDEVGRLAAALRLRLAIAEIADTASATTQRSSTAPTGSDVLFDARSLQTAAFGTRGIGRFARSALLAVRDAVGDDRCVLLVDPARDRLPVELTGTCRQVVWPTDAASYAVLVQPSPMTASAEPLLDVLAGPALAIAVVYDFIPMHYPTIYLRHAATRLEYAAALDALRHYDAFIAISHDTQRELHRFLGATPTRTTVAWPAEVLPASSQRCEAHSKGSGPIVIMTGDEPRKNTYGALAAVGAATAGTDETRDVVVIGMAGQQQRVHHWSIAAGMRPGEARTLDRMDDATMHRLLAEAPVVVVASFDEGLSLPVIEALAHGTPVVAADIPAHRELIGRARAMAAPGDLRSLATAIRRTTRYRSRNHRQQRARLQRHHHQELEAVLGAWVQEAVTTSYPTAIERADTSAPVGYLAGQRISIGVATPWTPQRTGVADFSATTITALAQLTEDVEVTVYTTADAQVRGLPVRSVEELLARREHAHDALITVIGNSHFHIPHLQIPGRMESMVIAHDTRMNELYLSLRSEGGLREVMLRDARGDRPRRIEPDLEYQIEDMRLLQNAAFWEIANQARPLVLHSVTAADRIAAETGVQPHLLPFANQRVPETSVITAAMRQQARERLGFDEGRVHLGSFGSIDTRTKLSDVVVEAAAWLNRWGLPTVVHLVGSGLPEQCAALQAQAELAGVAGLEIVGFADEARFRDYLMAVDLGVQLRVSPLLGVSGPLSDLAAFGTPSLASTGLCQDVDTPDYVDRLPDEISPLLVAEAVEARLADPLDPATREQQRQEYLRGKRPEVYAEQLLALLRAGAP